MSDIKINFYARRASKLLEAMHQNSEAENALSTVYPLLEMGRERWLLPAYLRLQKRGVTVTLSDRFDPEAINVAHNDDLERCAEPWRYFLVSVRADRDPAFISHIELCQNNSSVWNPRHLFIPYWPQPGLVPRDSKRGTKIKTVAFLGKADNLAPSFKNPAFSQKLALRGINFRIEERQWHDYSQIDVVLAIRNGAPEYLCSKPASKLVNAWLAACPAILNPEHGYLELRQSDADFLVAQTAEEALLHITHLAENPGAFETMVANGRRRAHHFSVEAITSLWQSKLRGPIRDAFLDWKQWSENRRRAWYALGRLQRLGWGWQIHQQTPGITKAALRVIRRAAVLPRASTLPIRPYTDWY